MSLFNPTELASLNAERIRELIEQGAAIVDANHAPDLTALDAEVVVAVGLYVAAQLKGAGATAADIMAAAVAINAVWHFAKDEGSMWLYRRRN